MKKRKCRRNNAEDPPLEDLDDVCVRDFDPRCYWNDDLSEGGRVKKEGLVVKTRLQDHGDERVNFNCRVETFGRVLGQFCERKRKIVAEMGFERLFCLVDMVLPRNLCYWLATRVDVPNRRLLLRDGMVFNLSAVQVQWVLGLPDGPNRLPKKAKGVEMKREVRRLWEKYHTVSQQGVKAITRRTLMDAVEGPIVEGGEEDFKRVFLMVCLGDFLCPTTCHRFSPSLLPMVTVASDAAEYDFCSLVLDHLFCAIGNFAKRFYPDGFAKGCGGCTFFLAIFYLDRLRRPPVRWGVFPRISAWCTSEVNVAKNEDLLDSGDFGELGCYDLAYGESHPMLPRDVRPGPSEGVSRPIQNFLKIKGTGRKRRDRNSDLNPHDYVVMKAARLREGHGEGGRVVEEDDDNVEHVNEYDEREDMEEEHVEEDEEHVEEEEEHVEEEEEHVVEEHVEEEEEHVVEEAVGKVQGQEELDKVEKEAVVGEEVHREVGRQDEENCLDSPFNSAINSRVLNELMDFVVGSNPITDPLTAVSGGIPYVWSSLGRGEGKEKEKENEEENVKVVEGEGSVQTSSQYGNPSFSLGDAECNSSNMPGEKVATPHGGSPLAKDCRVIDVEEAYLTIERSRPQRKTKSSSRLSSVYVQTWRQPGLWRYRKRLGLFVTIASGHIVSPETALIRCMGLTATVEDCSTVMGQGVHLHPNVVRVAGVLYEKVWAEAFTGRSKRIMLDPEFGTEACCSEVGSVNPEAMSRACAHFDDVTRNKTDLIFIPVLHGSHWWCAAFSLKACEVAIIDPMDPSTAADVHHLSIRKLMYVVDTLLNMKYITWKLGRCDQFETYTVSMKNGGNVLKCGVQMLAAIKRSAWRLKFDVFMDRVEEEESWLLAEDVLCNQNEQVEVVKEMLDSHMKYKI